MWKIKNITPELVKEELGKILRCYIGPRMDLEYFEVCEILGCKQTTLEGWVHGEKCPNLANFLALCSLPKVGKKIAARLMLNIGLTTIQTDPANASPHEVASWLGERMADLTKKLEDGILDHVEEREFLPEALDLGNRLISWASQRLKKSS